MFTIAPHHVRNRSQARNLARGTALVGMIVVNVLALVGPSPAQAAEPDPGRYGVGEVDSDDVQARTQEPAVAAGVGPLAVVEGSHRCQNFGGTYRGYRAGHCADIWFDPGLFPLVRSQGQSFCQLTSGTIVPCVGILQTVRVRNVTFNYYDEAVTFACGRYTTPWNNPPCPSVRFQRYSSGLDRYCGDEYEAIVGTTIILPTSLRTVSSANWTSFRKSIC